MRILTAWDDAAESDLLQLYLSANDNEVHLVDSAEELLAQARDREWDAVLMSLAFPHTPQESYPLFQEVRTLQPDIPLVLACRPQEMVALPKFMINGLRHYIVRDAGGDYMFLLQTTLDSALAVLEAERSRELAERLRQEMDGVRRLQESIIPKGLNPPDGYAFVARYEPAQMSVIGNNPVVMAGGDYYDLFRPDEDTFVLLVGDASGHGLKACMSIMTMHTLVRMFTGDRYRDTAAFVAEINDRLCENSIVQSEGGFITLYYAALDTRENVLTWTSAGHPLALLHDLRTNEVRQIGGEDDGGLPLGIAAGMDYDSCRFEVPPASRVLLYTDGLTDALKENGKGSEAFGVAGIHDILQDCRTLPLDATLQRLFDASSSFTGGSGRHDDTSVVLLERKG